MGFASCAEYMETPVLFSEVEAELQLSSVDGWENDLETRLVDGVVEGNVIHDFWLLQYDANGVQVGTMKYYVLEDGQTSVSVKVRKEEGMRYFVIANTFSDSFYALIGDVGTLESFKTVHKIINGLNDLYVHTSPTSGSLMLNGEASFEGDLFKCNLYRTVAKLSLNITNTVGSNVRLLTVQVKNIPKAMYYMDHMLVNASVPFPVASESEFGDFDTVLLGADGNGLDSGQTASLSFYLPRNDRGTVQIQDEKQKNLLAPEYATYVEIIGVNSRNEPVRYRFYLGTEQQEGWFDFNVIPNTLHTVALNFSSEGASDDSRVEELGQVLLTESNSYIINPFSRFASRTYSVPIDRINKFWAADSPYVSGHQIDKVTYAGANVITAETEWEAFIIWQDTDYQAIKFVSGNGITAAADGKSCTGQGMLPFRFQTTADAYGKTTNILVGLRKKDKTDCLWSWHLWVTPYNPDECFSMTWHDGKYSYAVSGGEVHRYEDASSNGLWAGIYKDKFIMDRNLGAGSSKSSGGYDTFGLYYQYGRKDPFLRTKSHRTTSGGTTYVYQTVYTPTVYYTQGSDNVNNWVHEADKRLTDGKIWNDNSLDASSSGKSIFDPCPPGWQIPKKGTFNLLGTTEPNASEEETAAGSRPFGYNMYISAKGEGDTAFFPFTGYLTRASGTLTRNHSMTFADYIFGFIWFDTQSSSSASNMYRYRYSYDGSGVEAKNNTVAKNTANPVRCIRSNE